MAISDDWVAHHFDHCDEFGPARERNRHIAFGGPRSDT